jgi:glycosyltransferase involved in cell wall biosynthesis
VEAAWARLAQKAPQTRCAVIGKLPPRSDTRLKYLSQHPECQMLGVLRSAEISEWMSKAVALLAPFDEGVSAGRTSVITALAHGLPVVTTAGPATEEIWKHTEGVILVHRHPGDLADALMRLHLDEAYWEKASKEARAFYLAHFEWDKIVDQAYPEFVQAKGIKPHFQAASLKSR